MRMSRQANASLIFVLHFAEFINPLSGIQPAALYHYVGISELPFEWTGNRSLKGLPFKALEAILFNPALNSFSEAVSVLYKGFEAFQIIFCGQWLFIAF
jgi:hypothetical protein